MEKKEDNFSPKTNFHSIKILDEKDILVRLNGKANLKVGLCVGAYDLLHPGHIKHLESAKKLCDILIVGVTKDKFIKLRKGEGRPIIPEKLRCYAIAKLDCVDYVILSDYEKAIELIHAIKPDYYIKGPDYIGKTTPGILKEKEAIESIGGKIVFTTDDKMSTSEIVNRTNTKSDKPLLIISGGIVGAGKSTILQKLSKKYNFFYIDKDDINESFMTKFDKDKISGNKYDVEGFYKENIRDQTYFSMLKIAKTNLHSGHDVILDGYFSNKDSSKYITDFIKEISSYAKIVKINFECSKDILLDRIKERNRIIDSKKLENFEEYYIKASNENNWKYDVNFNTEGNPEILSDALYHQIINFVNKK